MVSTESQIASSVAFSASAGMPSQSARVLYCQKPHT